MKYENILRMAESVAHYDRPDVIRMQVKNLILSAQQDYAKKFAEWMFENCIYISKDTFLCKINNRHFNISELERMFDKIYNDNQ